MTRASANAPSGFSQMQHNMQATTSKAAAHVHLHEELGVGGAAHQRLLSNFEGPQRPHTVEGPLLHSGS